MDSLQSYTHLCCDSSVIVFETWVRCIFICNLSPYIFYWHSVPIYFVLAICPHIFFIGKVSPYIFYWQSVPIYCLLAKYPHILLIGKVSPFIFYPWDISYCETFFTHSIGDFFSPFSFLPFGCIVT